MSVVSEILRDEEDFMKKSKQSQIPMESTDFFETMPMTLNDAPWSDSHFVYRDDASIDPYDGSYANSGNSIENEIKTTAIITLVLVLITAVALSLFIWQGLGAVKGNMNQPIGATSSEL